MSHDRQPGAQGAPGGSSPALCRKVMVLVADDAFALAHLRPVLASLAEIASTLIVAGRATGREAAVEALGARYTHFDFQPDQRNPLREAAPAWALARILEAEAPDVVHMVQAKPVILGGLALKLVRMPHAVLHVTAHGMLRAATPASRLYRAALLRIVRSLARQPTSMLLAESPDDLAHLRASGADPGPRFAILGSTGVDPEVFPALPRPGEIATAAYVGPISHAGGIDLLMDAHDRLSMRGGKLPLELIGDIDRTAPDALDAKTIMSWCQRTGTPWRREVADIREVWRHAGMLVLPARSCQTIPRTLLEAASCARPLIVSNQVGLRAFVRDGVEGRIVPTGDVAALADALQQVAADRETRERMGDAARLRVLQGHTEAHVRRTVLDAYAAMLRNSSGG